jgi:hypothetical protein
MDSTIDEYSYSDTIIGALEAVRAQRRQCKYQVDKVHTQYVKIFTLLNITVFLEVPYIYICSCGLLFYSVPNVILIIIM